MKLDEFVVELAKRDEVETKNFFLRNASFEEMGNDVGLVLGGKDRFQLGKTAQEELCHLLGIPVSYYVKCGGELKVSNLEGRLAQLEGKKIIEETELRGYLGKEGRIESLVKADFPRYSSVRVFNDGVLSVVEKNYKGEEIELQEVSLDSGTFLVRLLLGEVKKEVRVGDITRAGLEVGFADRQSYFREGNVLLLGSYFYRLVCSNGAVTRECLRYVRVGDEGLGVEKINRMVTDSVLSIQGRLDFLSELAGREIESPENYIRGVVSRAGGGDRLYNRIIGAYKQEPDPTEYGVYNAITRAANSETLTVQMRNRLQVFGGGLLKEKVCRCPRCSRVLAEAVE